MARHSIRVSRGLMQPANEHRTPQRVHRVSNFWAPGMHEDVEERAWVRVDQIGHPLAVRPRDQIGRCVYPHSQFACPNKNARVLTVEDQSGEAEAVCRDVAANSADRARAARAIQ